MNVIWDVESPKRTVPALKGGPPWLVRDRIWPERPGALVELLDLGAHAADAVDQVFRAALHELHAKALANDAIDHAHEDDDAKVGVVPRIDQHRLERGRGIALGWRNLADHGFQDVFDTNAGLGRGAHGVGGFDADDVFDFFAHALGFGGRQVDLLGRARGLGQQVVEAHGLAGVLGHAHHGHGAQARGARRFQAPVRVLDGHRVSGGVDAILGRATEGAISGGEGRATLQLSRRDDLAGVVGDIQAGIIRAISFGYSVQRYEITRAQDRTDGVNVPLYRAVRWQPQEISFVTVPADPNAGTRGQPGRDQQQRSAGPQAPCEFVFTRSANERTTTMTEAELEAQRKAEEAEKTRLADQAVQEQARQRAQAEAAERAAAITELCARHQVPNLAAGLIRSAKSVEQAGTAVLEELASRSAAAGGGRNVHTVSDETQTRLAGIEEAVQHRVDPRVKLTDNGRQFRGMSLLEIGREHLERMGRGTRGMTRMQLASEILHFRSPGMLGTSDFASLFANVANKRLRNAYTENNASFRRWARRAPNAPDFKSMSVVQLGAAPDLLQTNEHGEFKYGTLTDGKETYSLVTYGRIVSLTRQAIVNDDLRGFDRLTTAFGDSSARLENRTVYAVLTANAALSDTGLLFNSTAVTTAGGHANLAGSGAVISVASLSAGRAAMRKQKGLQSEELNIAPAFLIVPATQEQVAYQFTSPNYVPEQPGNINEFRAGGRTALEPIGRSSLTYTHKRPVLVLPRPGCSTGTGVSSAWILAAAKV